MSKVIEKTYNLNWYYATPYCSGQRGQNERLNRDLRIFFPKGMRFDNVSFKDTSIATFVINNIPIKNSLTFPPLNYHINNYH